MRKKIFHVIVMGLVITQGVFTSCDDETPSKTDDKDPEVVEPTEPDTLDSKLGDGPIDFSQFSDTYAQIAPVSNIYDWAHYNVHDPSIIDNGDFFYCYTTDVAYGATVRPGHNIRRSKNLVEWEFVGWVVGGNGYPPKGYNHIVSNGGEPFGNLWAPYAMKYKDEYRVYYSLSSPTPRLSAIGLMVSDKPYGPFTERGLVVTSTDNATRQTNAIDPTVTVAEDGSHWFFYGSAWDGIYKIQLDPESGLPLSPGYKGSRVAQRAFTGNSINGNIEGPEIIYNEEFDKYYMFIAYDWLQTKYNVRVGRSDNPDGPFYDYLGRDMNEEIDDLPMILTPYRFQGHSGWQGVSHPSVFIDKESKEFYMGHQGRPGIDSYYMLLHIRQIHWTEDGWPMVSPERYAAEEETPVDQSELVGDWEQIILGYEVVPGYADEQTNPGFQNSADLIINSDGTLSGASTGTWTYSAPWLTFTLDGESAPFQLKVERGRDWENEVAETILFTGLTTDGVAYWGKKI
ncbi:arabinan endo-1,5-alpha-L-arabinosidase [Reichenbachiella ulvae]|uniref:Arabinan endo-1,5-alpha-L-arabinosidase n=1 Tax=Reichenbachiella ulvae TaxID=2980104 RepID=A0ABT3CNB6_9BACT|nr:arabinan endo-1,5-alpha-L-arabinosidase [Reichenbachiella ulvae]MCV9385082.1 arabinan endo-1,5-alpha-L-arabinosidase [Reichenbachiella ulvae]